MPDAATTNAPAPPDGSRRPLRWWKEVLFGAAVYAVYSFVRNQFGSAGGDPGPAYEHARQIIDLQDAMGLYFEADLQQWYLDLPATGLIRLWNVFYGVAHFVVTFAALVWLFRRDPGRYPLWRNTLALTTCLAVIGFAAYSLMPPRLLDDPGEYGACQLYAPEAVAGWSPGDPHPDGCDRYGFVDTIARYGGWISFGNEGMKDVSNQYAAMPSMHIGWSTWSALVLVPLLRRRWARILAGAYPLVTLACILVTANHYWIDGVGGLLCLGAGFALARAVTGRRWLDRRDPVPAGDAVG
ncbi:MAG TPA: phosphatase PAP2 family protein [Acidimicrobiales bacterium]|nr:phosphatase PAP2 family protein [Acidimicrobiales bacterium]